MHACTCKQGKGGSDALNHESQNVFRAHFSIEKATLRGPLWQSMCHQRDTLPRHNARLLPTRILPAEVTVHGYPEEALDLSVDSQLEHVAQLLQGSFMEVNFPEPLERCARGGCVFKADGARDKGRGSERQVHGDIGVHPVNELEYHPFAPLPSASFRVAP